MRYGRLENRNCASWFWCARLVSLCMVSPGPGFCKTQASPVPASSSARWPVVPSEGQLPLAPWFGQFCSRVPPASFSRTPSFSWATWQLAEPNGQRSPGNWICSVLCQNIFRDISREQLSMAHLRGEFWYLTTPYWAASFYLLKK